MSSVYTHKVTATEYCDFLNHIAASHSNDLFDEKMSTDPQSACIVRIGVPGQWHYEVILGRENCPISYVNDFDEKAYCNEATDLILEGNQNDEDSLKSNQSKLKVDTPITTMLSLAETSSSEASSQSFNPYFKDILGVATFFALGGYGLAGMMEEDWAPAQVRPEGGMTPQQQANILQQLRAAAVHPDLEGVENLGISQEGEGIVISAATTQNLETLKETLKYLEEGLQAEHSSEIASSFISREMGSSSDEASTRLSTEMLRRILATADEVKSERDAICSSIEAFNQKINLAEETSSEWSLLRGRALNTLDDREGVAESPTLVLLKQKGKFLSEILTKRSDHDPDSLSPISIDEARDLLSRSKEQALYWESEKRKAEETLEVVKGDNSRALYLTKICDEVLRNISDTQNLLGEIKLNEPEGDPLQGKMSGLSIEDSSDSRQTSSQQVQRIDCVPSHALSLEAQADLLLKDAESVTARSQEAYAKARNAIFENNHEKAFRYYERAIDLAKEAANAWTETEQLHLQLSAQPGKGGIRIYGQRLKKTWAKNAKAWKAELEELARRLDEIEKKIGGVSETEVINAFSALKLSELERYAHSLRKGAESLVAEANSMYALAQSHESRKSYLLALQFYEEAIFLANRTASAWRETEQAHIQWEQALGKKIRKWGKILKTTWTNNVRIWSSEMTQCAQKLEKIERNTIVKEMIKKFREATESKLQALKDRDTQDQIERNEIGNVYDVIARHYDALACHYQEAANACSEKNDQAGATIIAETTSIEGTIAALKTHLQDLLDAKKKWDEENPVDSGMRCLENDEANKRSVFKARFIGPLVRSEEVIDAKDGSHRVEMAAEHLMVVLKKDETPESFLEKLNESWSRLELVSKGISLYRLYFKPTPGLLFRWLESMDAIRKKIQDKNLAARCYPDYFMKMDSSSAPAPQQTGEPEITEPWALHSPHGVCLPSNLLSLITSVPPVSVSLDERPIRVAIIDTGIKDTHQAFKAKILRDTNGIGSYGYDATATTNSMTGYPYDQDGHGTHVAGIVAASPMKYDYGEENQDGTSQKKEATIAGLASQEAMVNLIIYKVSTYSKYTATPEALMSNAVKCIEHAKNQKAQIINCSWHLSGDENQNKLFEAWRDDLEKVITNSSDVVFVTAAGNEGTNIVSKAYYPANFSLPNLVTVAATNKKGELAAFSNFGTNSVHLTAPGAAIISTWRTSNNAYAFLSGTSMAAPYVTAALAHIKAKFPALDANEMVKRLLDTVDDTKKAELKVKYGSLNLAKALEKLPVQQSSSSSSPKQKKKVNKSKKKVNS